MYEEPVHSPVSTPDEAKDYSLVLNSGSRVPYYTHSKLRDLPWLNQFMPDPVVRLHPTTPRRAASRTGAQVRVFNQIREVTMKAEITEPRAARCRGRLPRLAPGRYQLADHARLRPHHRIPSLPIRLVRGRAYRARARSPYSAAILRRGVPFRGVPPTPPCRRNDGGVFHVKRYSDGRGPSPASRSCSSSRKIELLCNFFDFVAG